MAPHQSDPHNSGIFHSIDRREAIRIGGLSALGLGMANFFGLQAAHGSARIDKVDSAKRGLGKAKSCILVWLDGGPSHLETFDPKPTAAREIRGPLNSIATKVPGVHLSECFPEMAKRMDQVSLIRSMTSPLGEHNFGTHYLQTGFKPTPALEYPAFHAVASKVFDATSSLPNNLAVPNFRVGGSNFHGAGFLDRAHSPFSIESDPAKKDFRVQDLDLYRGISLRRLERRNEFVQQLDRLSGLDSGPTDATFEQSFRLVTSAKAKQAFDLESESAKTRAKYGNRTVGQSCLLARRLVERGVSFVTVNHKGWDTHNDLYTRIKDGYSGAATPVGLAPSLDRGVAALLDDLTDRGMLDETLVLVMGEFGRTPKLNAAGGRDHWPRVFSVALAGGGVVGGRVVGESDAVGENPRNRPTTPADLIATIYRLLGIDLTLELTTPDGRPIRITDPEANIVEEIL